MTRILLHLLSATSARTRCHSCHAETLELIKVDRQRPGAIPAAQGHHSCTNSTSKPSTKPRLCTLYLSCVTGQAHVTIMQMSQNCTQHDLQQPSLPPPVHTQGRNPRSSKARASSATQRSWRTTSAPILLKSRAQAAQHVNLQLVHCSQTTPSCEPPARASAHQRHHQEPQQQHADAHGGQHGGPADICLALQRRRAWRCRYMHRRTRCDTCACRRTSGSLRRARVLQRLAKWWQGGWWVPGQQAYLRLEQKCCIA